MAALVQRLRSDKAAFKATNGDACVLSLACVRRISAILIGLVTASLLIQIVSLAVLHLSIAAEASRLVWRGVIAIAGLAVLPLAFGPIVPIAHFIFESTGRSMLLVAQTIAALLIAALILRIVARWRNGVDADLCLLFAGVVVCQTIWLGSSIYISDYEQGVTTPDVWDTPIYVLDWLAAVGMCVLFSLAAWRTAKSSIVCRLLIGVYFLIVAVLAVGTVG